MKKATIIVDTWTPLMAVS